MKEKLLGKTPDELKEVAKKVGLPSFAAGQIARWMYVSRVKSIDQMTNISKAGREKLAQMYDLGVSEPISCMISKDGTKKYLLPVTCSKHSWLGAYASEPDTMLESAAIEAVMIPDDDRKTLCVSSQSGCKMGCKFCMTGRQGFHGNLSVADILSQFIAVDESMELTNAVFMGMGEPLDNWENVSRAIEVLTAPWGFAWSPKRITLSTIGVIPNLEKYLSECKCHLAVSLHDPLPAEREAIMPVQRAYPIEDVVKLIKQYDFSGQRRVSFEYTMFSGYNDNKVHADALYRLLRGLECRINLIRFHKIPDFPYETANDAAMNMFQQRLSSHGITCTIRASRGEDILAACGMLAGQHKEKEAIEK